MPFDRVVPRPRAAGEKSGTARAGCSVRVTRIYRGRDPLAHLGVQGVGRLEAGDLRGGGVRIGGGEDLLQAIDLLVALGSEHERGGEGVQQRLVAEPALGELRGGADDAV